MKEMCFSILLERLPEHYHVHYSIPPDFALSAVRVWTASAKNLREDFLYITNDPILLDKSWEKGSPALLYTDRPIEEAQETLLDLLDEYRCWYDSCVELILGGMDLPPFLDHVATVLANPVALFDAAGTLIHQAGTFQSGVGGTLWEEVLRYGTTPVEYIMPDEQQKIMQETDRGTRIIAGTFRKDPAHHFITVPVYLNGKAIGAFGMTDINAPLSQAQKALALDVCQLTEIALRGAGFANLLHNETHYCVFQLLQGATLSRSVLDRYLQSQGWRGNETWHLYRFPLPDPDCADPIIVSHMHHIAAVLPLSVLLPYEDGIIGICSQSDFDPMDWQSHRHLAGVLERISLRVQVSDCFRNFTHLRIAYGQCHLLDTYLTDNRETVSLFRTYYQTVFSGILREKNRLSGFCHPAVLDLWENGNDQGRIWVRNLKCYLLNGRSIAETARALKLHRNTLIYRLKKLEELLGEPLNYLDENMLLCLLVSCMLCETLET